MSDIEQDKPTTSSESLSPPLNESQVAPPRPIVAHVGLYQSFGAYLSFYTHVVERLFSDISDGREPADIVAPPLLFLMRHTMELGYKYTLWELHQINGDTYNAMAYKHHNLGSLHAALHAQYTRAVAKYDLPDSEVSNFKEYYTKTETGMKLFMALDGTSFNFRYPINKQGTQNFSRYQTVDLQPIKRAFDDAMILLCHTADVLGEYVDFHNWMEMEAEQNWY